MMMPTVSVIIPTYKDQERLQKCLRALSSQTLKKENFEVIVVNNSPDPIDVDAEGLNVIVLHELRPGSYAARNRGLAYATGAIVAFTDSDCIPNSRWLELGVEELLKSNSSRLAGAVEVFPEGRAMTPVECYESIFAFDQKENALRGVSVTANLFVKRDAFERVGNFNESLLSGGDTEWNSRATKSGESICFSNNAIILHPARRDWSELSKKIRRTTGGKYTINPNYRISFFRSIMPPIEAGRKIIKHKGTARTKILAFLVAYRVKVASFLYLQELVNGKSKPQRS